MKHTIIFLLLSQFAMAFAQDYLPIRQGRTYFFGLNNIVGIKSVEPFSSDYEVWHAYEKPSLCFESLDEIPAVFRDSFFVHKITSHELWVVPPNLWAYNLPYQVKLGHTAFFSTLNDPTREAYWVGEGVSVDSVFGELDSIRTLRVIVLDSAGVVDSTHNLSGVKFRLSKSFGALQWFGIYDVFDGFNLPFSAYLEYLTGISNPDIGEVGYDLKDIHDYQPGDELHWIDEKQYYMTVQGFYQKRTCISRDTVENGTIIRMVLLYTKRTKYQNYPNPPEWSNITHEYDTITIPIESPKILPVVRKGNSVGHYQNSPVSPKLSGIMTTGIYKSGSEWCISEAADYGGFHFCYAGLGCFNYVWSGFSLWANLGITYYKKDSTTWGTPLPDSIFSNAVSVSDPLSQEPIRVFPNPGTSIISLSGVADQVMIEVFDLTGKQVWRGTNQPQGIDLSALSAGMYYIRLPERNLSLKWRKE